MYLSASIRRLPSLVGLIDRCLRSELDQCLLASLEKKGGLIDYDSLESFLVQCSLLQIDWV